MSEPTPLTPAEIQKLDVGDPVGVALGPFVLVGCVVDHDEVVIEVYDTTIRHKVFQRDTGEAVWTELEQDQKLDSTHCQLISVEDAKSAGRGSPAAC
jgi:hypothetical protein